MKRFIYVMGLLSLFGELFSQESSQVLMEQLETGDAEEIDLLGLLERRQKLNVNKASKEDLLKSFLFNEQQAKALLEYIRENGELIALLELQLIDGFTREYIREIEPFLKLNDQHTPFTLAIKEARLNTISRFSKVIENQKGYTANDTGFIPYSGDQSAQFYRLIWDHPEKFSMGISVDKDAGELLLSPDYFSAHFFIKDLGILKKGALGDFHAQFGQGLTFWSGTSFGQTIDPLFVGNTGEGIRPHRSAMEYGFLRGSAFTLGGKKIQLTSFYAQTPIDGERLGDTTTSLSFNAYHRTENEISKRHSSYYQQYGAVLEVKLRNFNSGIILVKSQIPGVLELDKKAYQYYLLDSSAFTKAGAFYNYSVRNIHLFGEYSKTLEQGNAYLMGGTLYLSQYLSVSLLNYDYQKDFESTFSNSFGWTSKTQNEKGWYLGFRSGKERLQWDGYTSFYQQPWLTYLKDFSTYGSRIQLRAIYTANKSTVIRLNFHYRSWQEKSEDHKSIDKNKAGLRFHLIKKINDYFECRFRMETNWLYQKDLVEEGVLTYVECLYKGIRGMSFSTRYTFFDVPDYELRLYTYETDLPLYYAIPSFYGKGNKVQFVASKQWGKHAKISVKYSRLNYFDRDEIGSGNELIEGNLKSIIKAQLQLSF